MTTKTRWPKRIPRTRAIAALELAERVLTTDEDSEPADPKRECGIVVPGDVFGEWVDLAKKAVGA